MAKVSSHNELVVIEEDALTVIDEEKVGRTHSLPATLQPIALPMPLNYRNTLALELIRDLIRVKQTNVVSMLISHQNNATSMSEFCDKLLSRVTLSASPVRLPRMSSARNSLLAPNLSTNLSTNTQHIYASSLEIFAEAIFDMRWIDIIQTFIRPLTVNRLQQVEQLILNSRTNRFSLNPVPLDNRWEAELDKNEKLRTSVDFRKRQMDSCHKEICFEEINRRESAAGIQDALQRNAATKWRRILRSLTNERGAWGSSAKEWDEKKVYWKLDKSEDSQRQRWKLKRNYEGTDHKEARWRSKEEQRRAVALQQRTKNNTNTASTAPSSNASTSGEPTSESIQLESEEEQSGEKRRQALLLTNLKSALALDIDIAEVANTTGAADNLDDEDVENGWTALGMDDLKRASSMPLMKDTSVEEKTIFKVECEMVTPSRIWQGQLELTNRNLSFSSSKEQKNNSDPDLKNHKRYNDDKIFENKTARKDKRWALDVIREAHPRRYNLRRSAIELFLDDNSNYFFNFTDVDMQRKVLTKLTATHPGGLFTYSRGGSGLKKLKLTERWQKRQISNFEYLMRLNTLSGRTYNDLNQYPVFPWILQDFVSDTLDLSLESVYRDLSKPVGALDPLRLEHFLTRYEGFDDLDIPKFHYGTHYSSAGNVLFYLIRLEPYTTQALALQDGRFDHADRLFDSVPSAWHGCLTNPADVKELIPEFFYFPEFLKNSNQYDLGTKQTGVPVSDVVLPLWAKNDPAEFIRIMRKALESDYVSDHLHEWIDLIFGYKQRGAAAEEACNVFFHLTYEGAVDIDSIQDPVLRKATLDQISQFGQTPSQIMTRPHPRRLPVEIPPGLFHRLSELKMYQKHIVSHHTGTPLIFCACVNDKALFLGLDRILHIHKWKTPPNGSLPPSIVSEETKIDIGGVRRIGVPFASGSGGLLSMPYMFAIGASGKYLISCGHWDHSFKISLVDTGKVVQSITEHKDVVTCLAIGEDGRTLVTGSRDTTLMVWDLNPPPTASAFSSVVTSPNIRVSYVTEKPRHVLYGHDDEVSCVAINTDLDIAVSASKDGTAIIHTLRRGRYVRSLVPPKCSKTIRGLQWVSISSKAHIVLFSLDDLQLFLFDINGRLLAHVDAHERIHAMSFSQDGEFLITGGSRRLVVVRSTHNLQMITRFEGADSPIRSLHLTPGEHGVIAGLQSGHMCLFALDTTHLRERTLQKLASLGF
eukprot:GILK01012779.1.p1 GENE.GILK01012779.1~~GILK01012779.1.p1  ORF type:complete len:1306 (+),score=251.28 GILK01012779.1:285-3920(+)